MANLLILYSRDFCMSRSCICASNQEETAPGRGLIKRFPSCYDLRRPELHSLQLDNLPLNLKA